jgi:hypothetical protein
LMSDCLIDRFLAFEVTEHVRDVLLDAIDAEKPDGTRYFTFNAFNVLLDFDRGSATIEDEFDVVAMCRIRIAEFATRLRAAAGGSG